MLLYPSNQDKDHFAWDSADITNLRFTAKAMNTSWGATPIVSFALIFDGANTPQVSLSTSKPGIIFLPYDETKLLLFRYDFIIPTLVLAGVFIAVGIATGKHAARVAQNRITAYTRVFVKLYQREVEAAKEIQVTTAKEISTATVAFAAIAAHLASNRRLRYGEKYDKRALDYASTQMSAMKAITSPGAAPIADPVPARDSVS